MDPDWRFWSGRYSLTGFWAASHVTGDRTAIDRLQRNNVHSFQRPDSDVLTYDPTRTSLSGHAGSISFNKIGGLRTRCQSIAAFKSPGFEINDLGFMQRADEITQSNWCQVRNDQPGKYFRSVNVNFNQWSGFNFDHDRRYIGVRPMRAVAVGAGVVKWLTRYLPTAASATLLFARKWRNWQTRRP